jgi:hypothetical protein
MHCAGVGLEDPETDAHGRRLARAVGAEEAEDAATRHLEGEVIEGDGLREALRDVIDLQGHGGEHKPGSSFPPLTRWSRRAAEGGPFGSSRVRSSA